VPGISVHFSLKKDYIITNQQSAYSHLPSVNHSIHIHGSA